MAESESSFVNLFDAHYGYERAGGHLRPLHDQRAIDAALTFIADFKPATVVFGGDMLDCGVVSHWREGKPRQTEGLRLKHDAEGFKREVLAPLALVIPTAAKHYALGNHEHWLSDYLDAHPELEGLVDLPALLNLNAASWQLTPQGQAIRLGKLYIVHGDQIKGGQFVAKRAVELYQRNIHFGHHHTAQTWTMVAPLDDKPKQGVAVPSLCKRNPGYLKNAPNRWVQGFEYGWVEPGGAFHYHVVQFVNNRFWAEGRTYKL